MIIQNKALYIGSDSKNTNFRLSTESPSRIELKLIDRRICIFFCNYVLWVLELVGTLTMLILKILSICHISEGKK